MPITDNSIITELDNLTVTADPQTYNYDTLTAVDTDRSAASQIIVLAYFTTFADGSAVTDYTWTNWYDPFLIPLNDTSGNIFLTFNDALKQVTLSNISTSVVTHTTGSKNRPAFDGSNYTKVRLMRSQNLNSKATLFNPGGRITSTALNNAVDQLFTSCQELEDRLVNVEGATFENSQGFTIPKSSVLAPSDDIINRTIGTAANNVVALDSSGKLPAIDGSNLTNISGGPGGSGDMTGVDITAGNGMDITQSNTTSGAYTATISADLKANGGIVIESTEMAVDLGASAITGTLAAADGGTGLTSISTLLNSNTTKSDVGLGNVENTALSTFAGSSNITTLGTIATGVWNGTTIAAANGGTGLTSISTLLNSNTTKSDVGLGNVENTALSTWAGSGNITQVGTISSGTWGGTAIAYADVSGTPTLGTAASLAVGISNTNVLQADANVVDDDFLRVAGSKVEGRTAAEVLLDIGAFAASGVSSFGATLIDDADAAAARTTLGAQATLTSPVTSPAMTGVSAGSITGVIKCSQSQYDAITPNASILYVIV